MYNAASDTTPQTPADYPPQPPADYPPPPIPPSYEPPPQQAGYPPPQQAGYAPPPQHMSQQTSNTTVIIQQPQVEVVIKGPEQWSSGLFDVFEDCGLCT